jgi:hypothetical protein
MANCAFVNVQMIRPLLGLKLSLLDRRGYQHGFGFVRGIARIRNQECVSSSFITHHFRSLVVAERSRLAHQTWLSARTLVATCLRITKHL